MLMITDKLPEIVRTQVEAIKNLKIDKITVWDNMSSGKDGKSPTSANFLSGMLGSIPPFEELFKMAGLELPDYLKGKKVEQIKELIQRMSMMAFEGRWKVFILDDADCRKF